MEQTDAAGRDLRVPNIVDIGLFREVGVHATLHLLYISNARSISVHQDTINTLDVARE